MLFRRKEERYVIELTRAQQRLFVECMMRFRNKCLREGLPTEDIDDILLELIKV